jgi:hypothetical protein
VNGSHCSVHLDWIPLGAGGCRGLGSKPPPPGRARNWGDRVGFVGGPEEDLCTGRRYWNAHVEGKRSVLDEHG